MSRITSISRKIKNRIRKESYKVKARAAKPKNKNRTTASLRIEVSDEESSERLAHYRRTRR